MSLPHSRQVTLVFNLSQMEYPEACQMPINEFADQVMDEVTLGICLDDVDFMLMETDLTHMIVRDLEGYDEKNSIARRIVKVTHSDEADVEEDEVQEPLSLDELLDKENQVNVSKVGGSERRP